MLIMLLVEIFRQFYFVLLHSSFYYIYSPKCSHNFFMFSNIFVSFSLCASHRLLLFRLCFTVVSMFFVLLWSIASAIDSKTIFLLNR